MLARQMAAPRRLPFITTLHGTDITLVGNNPNFLPITRYSIEQSDGVTSISRYLLRQTVAEFGIKRAIEVIPNFVNCDLYVRKPDPKLRAQWAPDGEPILMHLSNFRPVKRILDAIEIFAKVREKMPAKLVMIGDGPTVSRRKRWRAHAGSKKTCCSWANKTGLRKSWGRRICFYSLQRSNLSVSPRSRRWPAKFP